jgi:hypothetical protein
VDLSGEVRTKHPGGALDEILTVYTIVNALTVNLPAIQRVQILIDGKEADTLAGHVDLRYPLPKQLKWIKADKESEYGTMEDVMAIMQKTNTLVFELVTELVASKKSAMK